MKSKIVASIMSLTIVFSSSLSGSAKEAIRYQNPTQYMFSVIDYDSIEPDPVTKEVVETAKNVYDFSEQEVLYLKKTITAECGYNQPDNCVRSTTDVVINRVGHKKFANSIQGVVSQKNQFETYSNGAIGRVGKIPEQIDRIVDEEIENGVADSNVLFFTAGYYNPYCIPDYKAGDHYFGH